ncbi:MAG: type IV secretory system conjugative DNA transfer family protein [Gallionellaceae bacterium]
MKEFLSTDPAIWVIRALIFAHPYLQLFGLFSLFLVVAFHIEWKSPWFRVVLLFFLVSLADPACWWVVNSLLTKLELKQLSYIELRYWAASWIGGIILAFAWLRYVQPGIAVGLSKVKRTSSLERNKRTDVREIGKFLPSSIDFDPLRYINLKKGIFLGLDEKRKPIYIDVPTGTSASHIQVVGTTGSGKGVALGVMGAQFMERGEAVFFCDPKNDEWAPHVMFAAAQRSGKPYYFINLNRPNGAQFNPFDGATEEEVFELFQAGFSLTDKGDMSDFHGIADRAEALQTARQMVDEGLNLAEVFKKRQRAKVEATKFEGRLRELAEMPSVNAQAGAGIDLEKVIEEGGCVYVVGSMRNDIVKTVQRILLIRLIQIAERRDRIAGNLRPMCIVLDEVKYHLSRPALEALGAARDKGVHLVLAHQSLGDLRDCTKDMNADAVIDAIVENCRFKICYQVLNPETAEWLAKMSGQILVDDEIRSVEKNLGQADIVRGERSIRQAERYLVDVNMLLNLPRGSAVVLGDGLAKFVSIRPIKTQKTQEAIRTKEVQGTKFTGGAAAIDV